jgi:hypothetical protein
MQNWSTRISKCTQTNVLTRVGHLCHMFTFFFILLYFLLVKYMCKFADRLTHFSMYGSTTAIHKLLYNFQFVLFTYEILLYDLYYGQLFGIVSNKVISLCDDYKIFKFVSFSCVFFSDFIDNHRFTGHLSHNDKVMN